MSPFQKVLIDMVPPSSPQNPCDRNVLDELSSGQLQQATPTTQPPPVSPDQKLIEDGSEEDIDLDLDDLDLNADVSVTYISFQPISDDVFPYSLPSSLPPSFPPPSLPPSPFPSSPSYRVLI